LRCGFDRINHPVPLANQIACNRVDLVKILQKKFTCTYHDVECYKRHYLEYTGELKRLQKLVIIEEPTNLAKILQAMNEMLKNYPSTVADYRGAVLTLGCGFDLLIFFPGKLDTQNCDRLSKTKPSFIGIFERSLGSNLPYSKTVESL